MSRETDAIADYFAASGLYGMVTGLNTPGVHGSNSRHYWLGTKAKPRKPLDTSDGSKSCAADFGFPVGQRDSPDLLAIFEAFWRVRAKLGELIYSGPGAKQWISRGVVMQQSSMAVSIANAHHNHVHVGVNKGMFLTWTGPSLAPVQPVVIPPPLLGPIFPEDQVRSITQTVPRLDKDGNGYVDLAVPYDRVISFVPQGSNPAPGKDGYWKLPQYGRQDLEGKTRVEINEGPPNGSVTFTMWVVTA